MPADGKFITIIEERGTSARTTGAVCI